MFSRNYFRNTIRVPNYLDPDLAPHSVGSDLGKNVCEDYQQITLVCKELRSAAADFPFPAINNNLRVYIANNMDPDQTAPSRAV